MSFPLPPELTLSILSHLPISSLPALNATSLAWYTFIQTNESAVYRNIAIESFSLPPSTTFSGLNMLLSQRAVAGATDWKALCKAQHHIEQSWLGKAASSVTFYPATGPNVHRIKVDEHRGLIVTTAGARDPRLRVVDMNTGELVWALPERYVCAYAHCEYDNGYIIFNRRFSSDKEVWRLVEDGATVDGFAPSNPPDELQLRAAEQVSYKRKFIPWALLRPPENASTRAFRLAYPTLMAASATDMYFWDVPSGALVRTIPYYSDVGELNYVEVSRQKDGLAFICGTNALRAFSRATGRRVLDIPSTRHSYADNSYVFEADEGHLGWLPSAVLKQQPVQHRNTLELPGQLLDEFVAVHISECGSHIAALLSSSRLIIIPFFHRVIDGQNTLREIALDVQVGSPRGASKYLSFENGRIGLATVAGIYVLSLDFDSCLCAMSPEITVVRAAWFNSAVGLNSITCLQLGPSGIYFNWSAHGLVDVTNPQHCSIAGENLPPDGDAEGMYAESLLEDRITARAPNGSEVVQVFEFAQHSRFSYVVSVNLTPVIAEAGHVE
ncbi:F-box domain-containing protein [Mycena indigotica]|uniref:F-box domain-containing protein n=1 Tax=Mycena indigotica TaxID=2126181 RepID=A0A8H6TG01_9AGAR|nr:F-box domain-containing protein [Mycena indigotica]KAF7316564.1 F-box domain-containing protein [Mycena indigotica]